MENYPPKDFPRDEMEHLVYLLGQNRLHVVHVDYYFSDGDSELYVHLWSEASPHQWKGKADTFQSHLDRFPKFVPKGIGTRHETMQGKSHWAISIPLSMDLSQRMINWVRRERPDWEVMD